MKKKAKAVHETGYMLSPLNNPMINYHVYVLSPAERITYTIMLLLAGGVVGLIFYGGLFKVDGQATTATHISNVVVFLAVGCISVKVFMSVVVDSLINKRSKALQRQFMDFMEALSTSLSSGNNLLDSVHNARNDLMNQYDEDEMIIMELEEIISGVENGLTLEDMLSDFGSRSANEDIMNFSNVISNCYRMGGNFSDVVRRTRDIISDKIAVSDEINTKISSNRLQHNAMCVMPIILVGMIKLSSPEFASNLSSFLGVIVTTIAIGIFVVSYFWGQKIIDIG